MWAITGGRGAHGGWAAVHRVRLDRRSYRSYRRRGLPGSAREIRKIPRTAAVPYGLFAEIKDDRPRGRVVNIEVQRLAAAQAVYDAPQHHVVHSAVGTALT